MLELVSGQSAEVIATTLVKFLIRNGSGSRYQISTVHPYATRTDVVVDLLLIRAVRKRFLLDKHLRRTLRTKLHKHAIRYRQLLTLLHDLSIHCATALFLHRPQRPLPDPLIGEYFRAWRRCAAYHQHSTLVRNCFQSWASYTVWKRKQLYATFARCFRSWLELLHRRRELYSSLKYTVAAIALPSALISLYHLLKFLKADKPEGTRVLIPALLELCEHLKTEENFQAPFPQDVVAALCVAHKYYATLRKILHAVEIHCTQKIDRAHVRIINDYGKLSLLLLCKLLCMMYSVKKKFQMTRVDTLHLVTLAGEPIQEKYFDAGDVHRYLKQPRRFPLSKRTPSTFCIPSHLLFTTSTVIHNHLQACNSLTHVYNFILLMHGVDLRGQVIVARSCRARIVLEKHVNPKDFNQILANFRKKKS